MVRIALRKPKIKEDAGKLIILGLREKSDTEPENEKILDHINKLHFQNCKQLEAGETTLCSKDLI